MVPSSRLAGELAGKGHDNLLNRSRQSSGQQRVVGEVFRMSPIPRSLDMTGSSLDRLHY